MQVTTPEKFSKEVDLNLNTIESEYTKPSQLEMLTCDDVTRRITINSLLDNSYPTRKRSAAVLTPLLQARSPVSTPTRVLWSESDVLKLKEALTRHTGDVDAVYRDGGFSVPRSKKNIKDKMKNMLKADAAAERRRKKQQDANEDDSGVDLSHGGE
jgi:hypothetical protein